MTASKMFSFTVKQIALQTTGNKLVGNFAITKRKGYSFYFQLFLSPFTLTVFKAGTSLSLSTVNKTYAIKVNRCGIVVIRAQFYVHRKNG